MALSNGAFRLALIAQDLESADACASGDIGGLFFRDGEGALVVLGYDVKQALDVWGCAGRALAGIAIGSVGANGLC